MFGMELCRLRLLVLFGVICCIIVCSAQVNPYSKCPTEEMISPCKCEKDCDVCQAVIVCANITNMATLFEVMNKSDDFPFRTAEFRDSVLEYIPATLFEQKQYRIILIVNTTLVSVLDRPVTGDPPLFFLKLKSVRVTRGASFEYFKYFKHLRFLVIENIPIRKITQKMMDNLPTTLEGLDFKHTSIDRISPNAFSRFEKMTNMYLVHGNIKSIEASMFPKGLGQLMLSYNKITTIPADFTKDFTRLFNLYLDHNLITILDQAAIGRNVPKNIGYINLEGNPIVCNCKAKWIVDVKKYTIMGKCENGKEFKQLTAEDFIQC